MTHPIITVSGFRIMLCRVRICRAVNGNAVPLGVA